MFSWNVSEQEQLIPLGSEGDNVDVDEVSSDEENVSVEHDGHGN